IVAQLQHHVPQIFSTKSPDGSMFQCSETWVRSFLLHNLHWRMCQSTHTAQKLPTNVNEVCLEQFFRLALTIQNNVIHSPVFYMNINQTNVI
ncbi:hypothetical protein PAXRUDRAFT_59581, partial [Paxillus rubicundulus Ve08.2h10]